MVTFCYFFRLEYYDQNADFGQGNTAEGLVYNTDTPDEKNYRDVNSNSQVRKTSLVLLVMFFVKLKFACFVFINSAGNVISWVPAFQAFKLQ